MSKPLLEILKKYASNKKANDFILNAIKSDEPKNQLINFRHELRRYNRSPKEIGTLCGIESSISSYAARHSYATNTNKLRVPTAIISEARGNSPEKTTQIYLDSFFRF